MRAPGQRRGEVAQVLRRRAAPAAHRQSSSPAAVSPPCSRAEQRATRRRRASSRSWASSTSTWRQRAATRARTCGLVAQQRDGAQDEVAEVQRALLAQHPVVGLVDGRRTRARARRARRPAGSAAAQRATSSAVTIASLRRSMRAMTPPSSAAGLPLEVVEAQRQLVDALEQHRQAVGGRDRDDEGVEPGLERLVVQQARAEAVRRCGRRAPRSRARARPRRRCAGASAAASEAVRARTCSGARPPAEASHAWRASSARVLPVPAAPTTSSGPAAMRGDLALRGGEAVERIGHAPRI